MAFNRIWNNQGMKTVLVDTNIILWTFNGGPDFREAIANIAPNYNLVIPTCIMFELEKLNTKESLAATNDKDILKKLKSLKLNALKIREKNKMIFTEGDMA